MAQKPKPKGWNAMSKAKQDAWKKANFDKSQKVQTSTLDKLRAEKTPEKAIAKYKNDPAMREALNRFYGKARVDAAGGSSTTTGDKSKLPPGKGPGNTRPKTAGPNYIGAGNVANYKTVKVPGSGMRAIGAVTKAGATYKSMDQQKRAKDKATSQVLTGASLLPVVGVAGKIAPKLMPKVMPKAKAAVAKVKSATTRTTGKHAATTTAGKHAAPKAMKPVMSPSGSPKVPKHKK
jgi:hypothetical protein